MDRRKFIRGTGLLGGLLGGVLAGKEVIERIHTKETIVKELVPPDMASPDMKPIGATSLILKGASKPPEPEPTEPGYYFISNDIVYDREVGLAAGLDNRLWIKVNNQWHRVSIDPTEESL